MIDTPCFEESNKCLLIHLWFISKYLGWYNDGITGWVMCDLTCLQSSGVCHSKLKTSYWAHGFTASAVPSSSFPKFLRKSSRGATRAPFSHAACPFWSLDGPDAKGTVTVTCFPGLCFRNFSSSTNNCYGNLTAAQVFSLPIYSKTQLQTVTAPNTYILKPLKSSDEKEWAGERDQPRE